jgi:hypothetical protein
VLLLNSLRVPYPEIEFCLVFSPPRHSRHVHRKSFAPQSLQKEGGKHEHLCCDLVPFSPAHVEQKMTVVRARPSGNTTR